MQFEKITVDALLYLMWFYIGMVKLSSYMILTSAIRDKRNMKVEVYQKDMHVVSIFYEA